MSRYEHAGQIERGGDERTNIREADEVPSVGTQGTRYRGGIIAAEAVLECCRHLQRLHKQGGKRLQMSLAELRDRAEVRWVARHNHHEIGAFNPALAIRRDE